MKKRKTKSCSVTKQEYHPIYSLNECWTDSFKQRKHAVMNCTNVVVALAAFWVNFCLLGVLRSNAVIFKALVDVYGVNREDAAWPSGIFGFCMCVTGALSGFLTYHISIRNLAMLGVLLSSVAVSTSSIATNINQIVYLYGALQGVGVGLVVPLTHVILNQHFSQYRALALGVAYSGSSAGSFIFPYLSSILLEEFGLGGCLLLLGGVMLNAMVGAALFVPPQYPVQPIARGQSSIRSGKVDVYENQIGVVSPLTTSNNLSEKLSRKAHQVHKSDPTPLNSRKEACCPRLVSSSVLAAEVLLNPHFLIVSVTYAVYFSTSAIFLMVILDFAQDRGVPLQDGVYLVSAFSAGDCAGRLSFGWIADARLVARHVLVRAYLLAMGLLTVLLSFIPVSLLYPNSVLLGLLSGSVVVNHSVLLNEYLGLERLPLAVGFSMLFVGLTAMLRPLVIGVFRDQHESYDHLFMSIGLLQMLITALWSIGSLAHIIRKRRNKAVE